MTVVVKQLWVALAALICVLSFWMVAAAKAGDVVVIATLALPPAACGSLLVLVIGRHAFALPFYVIALMLALGRLQIYPYYSTDFGVSGPTLFYSVISLPTVFIGASFTAIGRAIRRRKKPNQ